MFNLRIGVHKSLTHGISQFWQVPHKRIGMEPHHFFQQLDNLQPQILTGLGERRVINPLDQFLHKRFEHIVLDSVLFDLGEELANDLQGKLAIVLDLVPEGTLDDVLLEVGLVEETNDVGGFDLL